MLLNGAAGVAPSNTSNGTGGWLPTAIANAFGYPAQYGFAGTGETIAIVNDAFPSASDLSTFWSVSSLPTTPVVHTIAPDGVNASAGSSDVTEITLDTETAAGLAPYATTDVVEAKSLDTVDILSALDYSVQTLGANVVSMSFGLCEDADPSFDDAVDSVAQEAAATGTTIVASTGDDGPGCYSGSTLETGVSAPASDPYVVSVGGTESQFQEPITTTAQANAQLEHAAPWNDTSSGSGSAGGGVSAIWTIPSYQNAPGIVSTAASAKMRNVPDVVLPASVLGPAAVRVGGTWMGIGGTSWSAPEFAAMQAEIDQQCGASRWGLPDLYRVYYQKASSFHDVTSGSISYPGVSASYAAKSGYDNATGLGMPIGEQIAVQDGC